MSRVPESHAERLAPFIAAEESVIAGCVEEAPTPDGERSRTSVATDSRLVRLTVNADEEVVTSVPYSKVASASMTTTDGDSKNLGLTAAGVLLSLLGLVGVGFGTTLDEQMVFLTVLVAAGTLFVVGLALAATGLKTEDGEVTLELKGADGAVVYEAVLPRHQRDFAHTVSRLIGRHNKPIEFVKASATPTQVDPADA